MIDKRDGALMRARTEQHGWATLTESNKYVKDAGYVMPVDRQAWFAARKVA